MSANDRLAPPSIKIYYVTRIVNLILVFLRQLHLACLPLLCRAVGCVDVKNAALKQD